MHIDIGFSPCPNDTFIFDALVNNKIDTKGLSFNAVLEDVQTLNEWAIAGKLPVTKLSYGVLPLVMHQYRLLNSGSALGKGVGPLLISSPEHTSIKVEDQVVAIPGENTTAHLLFSFKYPHAKNKVFLRYDAIEDFVLSGKGLGVIIHENRFTYAARGLEKIIDLGDHWEQTTGAYIPLGGIVVKKELDILLQQKIDRLIQQSIAHAFENYPELNDYIRNNAQEMEEQVMRQHIDLYVNEFSRSLGDTGKKAVLQLLKVYEEMNQRQLLIGEDLFVPSF